MLLLQTIVLPGLSPSAVRSIGAADLKSSDAKLRGLHGYAENEIMNDLFRPANSELGPATASIIAGALPADLPRGAVLKNGPNPQPEFASEQGGWLDGDGMIHCVVLPPDDAGAPMYSRTWVKTQGYAKEVAAGKRLFDGSLVAPRGLPLLWGLLVNGFRALQPQKDTANTGLLPIGSDGRCLALMEQCLPSELQVVAISYIEFRQRSSSHTHPRLLMHARDTRSGQVSADGSVATLGAGKSFDGQLVDYARHPFATGALTAHLKTDPATGEKIGVTYPSNGEPGARVTTLNPEGGLSSDVMVPLEGSVQSMIHDCAITQSFTLLLDLPMTGEGRGSHSGCLRVALHCLYTRRLAAASSLISRCPPPPSNFGVSQCGPRACSLTSFRSSTSRRPVGASASARAERPVRLGSLSSHA